MDKNLKKLLSEYHIDAQDRLIYIDESWREFAHNNAASELVGDSILNKSLWNFIAGKQVQHLYQMLLAKVRQSGQPAQVTFWCDAPHARRFLELTMTPDEEAGVQFHSWLIREEEREPIGLLEMTRKRTQEFLVICSWCKKVKLDEESWAEVEEAVKELGLFEATELPQLSHGMCPQCAQTWLSKLEDWR